MSETRNLNLPLLAAGQAQKHVTVNEALALIDQLVQLAVAREATLVPPAEPEEGERHIVGPGAEGVFEEHAGKVAIFTEGAWRFTAPRAGWVAYALSEGALLVFDGGEWRPLETGGGEGGGFGDTVRLARLGIGTDADAANPFAAKLNNALWTARETAEGGSGDLRYTMNKESGERTLSLLLQSGYEGRAEIGLVGDEDLTLKVSADGVGWNEALRIDRHSGRVSLPAGADFIEPEGRCRLVFVSQDEVRLVRHDGAGLFVDGRNRPIPPEGAGLSRDGLGPNTLYYVYAFMSEAGPALEASVTAYMPDTAHGIAVREGDGSRTLVGMVRTNASGRFVFNARQRLVRSWFNRGAAPTEGRFTADRSTNSGAWVEVNPEVRNEALIWAGEAWMIHVSGSAFQNAVATLFCTVGIDGVSAQPNGVYFTSPAPNYRMAVSHSHLVSGLGEGFHYATILGAVNNSTGTWIGSNVGPGSGLLCGLNAVVMQP